MKSNAGTGPKHLIADTLYFSASRIIVNDGKSDLP